MCVAIVIQRGKISAYIIWNDKLLFEVFAAVYFAFFIFGVVRRHRVCGEAMQKVQDT